MRWHDLRLICLIGLLVTGCSGGTPRFAPRLRIQLDQDYVTRQARIGRPLDDDTRREHADVRTGIMAAGASQVLADPRPDRAAVVTGAVFTGLLADRTVEVVAQEGDGRTEIEFVLQAGQRSYSGRLSYGLNTIAMDEAMERDLTDSAAALHVRISGLWQMERHVPLGRIARPRTSTIHLRGDGRVFLDDQCLQ